MSFLGVDVFQNGLPSFDQIAKFSFMAGFLQWGYLVNSVKLLLLGSVIETGRRICYWLLERVRFQYCISAEFHEGDPSYEWIVHFLTERNVWRRSREFKVNSKTLKRRWAIKASTEEALSGNADYVPTYERPQLFRWKGIYTLDMSVLASLVEEARLLYHEVNRPHVTVHMTDGRISYTSDTEWTNVKHKIRRTLSSVVLQEGMVESLLEDAHKFLESEAWYNDTGIPYRRGYLLYGPPGTGKTSTIFALAGELGLEIYSLSLASGSVDDAFLQRATSSLPKHSILLIEDIDCAFASRAAEDRMLEAGEPINPNDPYTSGMYMPKSAVTLSGLLNVIDGVGSEEGRLFFATTNYIDRLDPALLRPGRIDKKISYSLATTEQATSLFLRFFPELDTSPSFTDITSTLDEKAPHQDLDPSTDPTTDPSSLASRFSSKIPPDQFSTAEIQGYLLTHRISPTEAVENVETWVEQELEERKQKNEREEIRKQKMKENRKQQAPYYPYGPYPPPPPPGEGAKKDGEEAEGESVGDGHPEEVGVEAGGSGSKDVSDNHPSTPPTNLEDGQAHTSDADTPPEAKPESTKDEVGKD
ncbi:P-loop containing nucleoside triphosphate hydrolase protein [Pluteus cervinus]|uniref:P-loop containing nucleoside triphosphate hydrolase protein n=1 Tax=Pluteus cervinus TaxID=181527 RepID=A0ACD3AMU7_9AGAR|nr:P-loop containing nucleoside triphosphate hydrolase protein [Pluteus cervinus]